jgi:hypothetical protein
LCDDYLESHARRIYSAAISPERAAAYELGRHPMAGWKLPEGRFIVRDVCFNRWRGLDTVEKVRPALSILTDAGLGTAGRGKEEERR